MEIRGPSEPDPVAVKAGHEVADVSVRGIFVFALFTIGVLVFGHFALTYLGNRFMEQRLAEGIPQSPVAGEPEAPPAPNLQAEPKRDYVVFIEGQRAQVRDYGWVDRPSGSVRIPIEEAMRLIAERGVPNPRGEAKPNPGPKNPAGEQSTTPNPGAPANVTPGQNVESSDVPAPTKPASETPRSELAEPASPDPAPASSAPAAPPVAEAPDQP